MSLSGCSYCLAKGGGEVGKLSLSSSWVHSSIVFNSKASAYSVGMLTINI